MFGPFAEPERSDVDIGLGERRSRFWDEVESVLSSDNVVVQRTIDCCGTYEETKDESAYTTHTIRPLNASDNGSGFASRRASLTILTRSRLESDVQLVELYELRQLAATRIRTGCVLRHEFHDANRLFVVMAGQRGAASCQLGGDDTIG